MPISPLRLIKNSIEYCDKSDWSDIPKYVRGIYVLYKRVRKTNAFNVVYVGMAAGEKTGVRNRIKSHYKKKAGLWTHFSIFQVWDNIREDEVKELEGLFRHIYADDSSANKLNIMRSYSKLNKIESAWFDDWD